MATTLLLMMLAGCSKSKNSQPAPPIAGRPPLTNVYRIGSDVDLLALIDPRRDTVNGNFRFDDEALVIPPVQAAQLNFEVELPEQYELLMEVARTKGQESLNLGIHVGGFTTSVVIEGWGRKLSGLNRVDGKLAEDNVTSQQFSVFGDSSSAKKIRVIVRRESVLVDVDGGVFIDFRGAPSRLSFDSRFFQQPAANQLMLGGWNTEFRVTSWKLTPLGDQPVKFAARQPSQSTDSTAVAKADAPRSGADSRTNEVATPVETDGNKNQDPERFPSGGSDKTPPDSDPSNDAVTAKDGTKDQPPAKRVPWSASVDPFPGWDPLVAATIKVPLKKGWSVIPFGPSPFFAVGMPEDDRSRWSVYDQRTGKPVGSPVVLDLTEHGDYELCPSGRYFLAYMGAASDRRIEVYSFVTGERVYAADSPDESVDLRRQEYLTSQHGLLSIRDDGGKLQFRRIDLRSGTVTARWTSGPLSQDLQAVAISPGGRFLVIHWNKEILVHDLSNAEIVGRLDLPAGIEVVETVAFTANGTELALLGRLDVGPSPIMWCIDWATGKTSLLAEVAARLDSLQVNYRLGPALEWFPNNELLLYYGRDVIDRRTGKFCYRMPSSVYWQMPRRGLPGGSVLAMMIGDDPDVREYRTVKMDSRQLDASIKVVRDGGIAQDIGLPPLTIADTEAGRMISSAENKKVPSIAVEARAAFAVEEVKLPLQLVRTRAFDTKLRRIQFASPEMSVAVAHFHVAPERPDEGEARELLVRFDLRLGKQVGSVPIREDYRLADVSPDGTRALLGLFNKVDAYSRVDVVDLTTKSHIAGWRPFAQEPFLEDISKAGQPEAKNPRTATWVRFVDEDRVLTVNPAGKLVCWRLPECTAIYSCEDFGHPHDFSANRRYLASSDGDRIGIIDVRSGAWVGILQASETPQAVLRVAIHPDCKELAAILGYQGRREMIFWDLAGGKVVEQFDLLYSAVSPGWNEHRDPGHRQIGLEYHRDGYLMLDDLYLIDRRQRTTPWRYSIRQGQHAVDAPDRRAWFAHRESTSDGTGQVFDFILGAAQIPSDEVLKLVRDAAPAPLRPPVGLSAISVDGEKATREP